jgi:uncharacterized protein
MEKDNELIDHLNEMREDSDISLVSELISSGVDPNLAIDTESTVLTFAISIGRLDIVKVLVNAGADVNFRTDSMDFALQQAAYLGWDDIYDYLFPLTSAKLRKEAKLYLEDGNKNKNIRSYDNSQLVKEFDEALDKLDLDKILKLKESGFNINACDPHGFSYIGRSCSYGHAPSVRLLLQAGADANIKCSQDNGSLYSPLMYLIRSWHKAFDPQPFCEIANMLIESGANPNDVNEDGRTALMIGARQYSHLSLVEILINGGTDLEIEDRFRTTAILIAGHTKDTKLVQYLRSRGANDSRLIEVDFIEAARLGNLVELQELINRGVNINAQNSGGFNALMYSSSETINFLVSKGANLNIQNASGDSALLHAVGSFEFDNARCLIEAGADIHLQGSMGDIFTLTKNLRPKTPELKAFAKYLKGLK